jgi:quercetin dioxygenase-like cupin family protein
MLVPVATARPPALFEAYNICGRRGWEGDLMAIGARSGGDAIIPRRSNPKNSAAELPGFVLRLDGRSGSIQPARTILDIATTPTATGEGNMAALEKGITANGTGYGGKTWNILGQVYFPKAVTDSTFAFETNSAPGQFVPVHVHPTQDEFILVQEGTLDLKLDGVWVQAKAGDLVRMPRGIPHGYFNKSDKPARALFWVSPMQKLEALFNQLHNLTDPAEVVRISAQYEVNFLPPEANE